jgi:hypothetical protein
MRGYLATNLPEKRPKQPAAKSKDWKHAAVQGIFQVLGSVPVPARVNLFADLVLVTIFFLGGKQAMPPEVHAVGYLFCLFFVAGCVAYSLYRRKRRN